MHRFHPVPTLWGCKAPLLAAAFFFLATWCLADDRSGDGSAANARAKGSAGVPGPQGGLPMTGGNAKASERLREGTRLIDVPGSLGSVGADSVTFSPEGSKDSYRILENLMMQRVVQVLDDNRGPRKWVVSGLITEYRGSNYLLLTKAVFQQHDGDTAAGH